MTDAPRYYALAERPWVKADGGSWGLPNGAIGAVDLAPVGGHSYVFCASHAKFNANDVAVQWGDGRRLDELATTAAMRSTWATLLGVTVDPGATLLDALWQTLTVDSDPDGELRSKPIMPTHRGVLELHLGGHSLIRAERLPTDPTQHPSWQAIRRVVQNDYRKIQGHDQRLARKWLGAMRDKYRLTDEAARDLLIPQGLPRVLPDKPTTTITESWPTNGTTISTGQDLTWAEVSQGQEVSSNRLASTSQAVRGHARAEHDLSSDDHYAQTTVYGFGANVTDDECGGLCRFDSSANTCYEGNARRRDIMQIRRYNGGSITSLWSSGSGAYLYIGNGDVVKTQADGSSISVYLNGGLENTVTDSNITGNLRTGVEVGSNLLADDFEAADLAGGVSIPVIMQAHRRRVA